LKEKNVNMPPPSPPEWKFIGHACGIGPFMIDGVDVFQHDWHAVPGAPTADVKDPLYHQSFSFPVFEIVLGPKRIVFAAGEFSNNVWGFYRRPRELPSLHGRHLKCA
jgi:hypothetical protein